jgi:peptidyl-dipeptidase Dcp
MTSFTKGKIDFRCRIGCRIQRLLQYYKQNFEIAGAALSAQQKEQLKQVNQQLAKLETLFSNKLLDARKQGGY